MTVPAAAAARAIPGSPSGCASLWIAVGATSSGIETGVPSTVVAVETSATSTRTRGRSAQRAPRLDVSRERELVAGAAGVVAEGARLEPFLREALEIGDADRVHAAESIPRTDTA